MNHFSRLTNVFHQIKTRNVSHISYVDECNLGSHDCGALYICRNTQGSYRYGFFSLEIKIKSIILVVTQRNAEKGNCRILSQANAFLYSARSAIIPKMECAMVRTCIYSLSIGFAPQGFGTRRYHTSHFQILRFEFVKTMFDLKNTASKKTLIIY